MTPPVVLAIAATDPGGGAGLAADLTTVAALGVHGACVVTAVTVQDTLAVRSVHPLPLDVVAEQIEAVLDDLDPRVVKTGMLGSAAVVRLVADRCRGRVVVVDPVLRASTGAVLAGDGVVAAYRDHLLPVAAVVTPNADEDEVLGRGHGAAVLRTGSGGPDVLHRPGHDPLEIVQERVDTTNDHGTGCTHASALAAYLALGHDLPAAARRAADFTAHRLTAGASWDLGRGRGPIAHISTSSTSPTTATEGVTP